MPIWVWRRGNATRFEHTMESAHILGMRVDATSYEHASNAVCQWAEAQGSRYVCIANVYNAMTAYDSVAFRRATNEADLVTPDGVPLVWCLRLLGHGPASRVYGPDLTQLLLSMAASKGLSVGFYGSSPLTVLRLQQIAQQRYPGLHVVYAFSPPFRALTSEEDERVVMELNRSGVRILFVGLGTPNQDYWMAAHRGRIRAVMLGVGAAFDFMAGTKPQAPRWMMRIGMEWFFRFATEPRRLWTRYLKQNPRFVMLFALQLLGLKKFADGSAPRS